MRSQKTGFGARLPRGADIARAIKQRPALASLVLGCAAFAFMLLRGFVPTAAGLADNGDAARFLCQFGLKPEGNGTRFFDFAIFRWRTIEAPRADCDPYPSSQLLLFRLWMAIGSLFGETGVLDLRWAIVVNALLVAVLTAVLARVMVRGWWRRVAVAVLFVVVVSDPVFSNYAASVLGEYPGLAGIAVLAVGAALSGGRGWWRVTGFAMFAVGSLLAITSKTQGVTLIVPLAAFLLIVRLRWPLGRTAIRARLRAGRRVENAFVRWVPGRLLPAALVVALGVAAVPMVHENPYRAINAYEVLTVGVLAPSSDPEADLAEMGLPTDLAKYRGKSYWVEDSISKSADWDRYKGLFTYERMVPFLIGHPDRVLSIAARAGNDLFSVRPPYLGTYAQDAGFPARAQNPSLLAAVGSLLSGSGLVGLVVLFVPFTASGVMLVRRSRQLSVRRGFAQAALLLVGIGLTQFVTAAFGEAIENTKHLVYAELALFLAPAFLVIAALCPGKRRPASHWIS